MVAQTDKKKKSPIRFWVIKHGNLYARFQYRSSTGKTKDKYKPISEKRQARSAVEEMRRELESHGEEIFVADKMTFDELADKYEAVELVEATYQDGVKVKGRRSISSVRSAIRPLRMFFGKMLVRSIKPVDIRAYKNARLSTPIETEMNERSTILDQKSGKTKTVVQKVIRTRQRKIGTVNRELSWLRAILNFAITNDWLIKTPFAKMKGVISMASEVERDRVLSLAEEDRLLAVCIDERAHLRPMLICAMDTAMRRGEIFKMRWRDVKFDSDEISIPQTNTKTEESRIVGLTPRLKEELVLLWEQSPKDGGGLVFGITNSIKHAWATACDLAGITDFRFHDCRHTATTRMIASGSPHTEVMKITGHSQIKTFLRYLNLMPETTSKVASRLHNYLADRQISDELASEQIN